MPVHCAWDSEGGKKNPRGVRRPRWAVNVHVHTKYPVLLRGVRYASNLAVSYVQMLVKHMLTLTRVRTSIVRFM